MCEVGYRKRRTPTKHNNHLNTDQPGHREMYRTFKGLGSPLCQGSIMKNTTGCESSSTKMLLTARPVLETSNSRTASAARGNVPETEGKDELLEGLFAASKSSNSTSSEVSEKTAATRARCKLDRVWTLHRVLPFCRFRHSRIQIDYGSKLLSKPSGQGMALASLG